MTIHDELPSFDLCGCLPVGVTVLEASAGTGKTFTIAALAARYVAEGVGLHQMLLVTFTRMATGDLKERVRERLVSAEEGLTRAMAGIEPAPDDEILRLLSAGPEDAVRVRRDRLAAARREFDAATIATTHSFCDQVLRGLGVAGDVDRDAILVEDVADRVDEIVDDFYLRKYHRPGTSPHFDRAEARRIARAAVANPVTRLEPQHAAPDSAADQRRRLAEAVRLEADRRKRMAGVLTYDDLQVRLRDILADPARGSAARARLRARYRVVLVDEFQDTDPTQWDILRLAFGSGDATLVLIGDPKQAIYAFRGADVYAYLDAARHAGAKSTLDINWRSDQGLLDAYDTLFGLAKLGHSEILYRHVDAAVAHRRPRLVGAPVDTPLRFRILRRDSGLAERSPERGHIAAPSGRRAIAADVAADLVRLLSSEAHIVTRQPDGSDSGRRPVRPGDVAVLVRTNGRAAEVRDALDAVGIPAVINGAGSVFSTPTARQWLRLLEALERPTATSRAASAALTAFLGWSAEEVAQADDAAWEILHARLHQWAGVLRHRGVASLLESITQSEGLAARVLGRPDGEREVTDIRHVGQLLHTAAVTEELGVTAMVTWLRQRIAEADRDTTNEERSRRLDSDDEAVQVLTVHRSKGLEFPIVYFPDLWDPMKIFETEPPVFHDPAAGNTRTIDIGGKASPGFGRHQAQSRAEQRGEELRLAYVALTRAQHQAIVWWAGSQDSKDSPLGRLLFARGGDGTVAPQGAEVPRDDAVLAAFTALAERAPGCITVEECTGAAVARWSGPPRPATDLVAGRFDRTLDDRWRRTSYSGITAGAHDARVASEAEQEVIADESVAAGLPVADDLAPSGAEEIRLRAVAAPLDSMPGGREVGTLVHAVLEETDFTAADLGEVLGEALRRQQRRQRVDLGDPAMVLSGLTAAMDTPLGPLAGDVRLRDIAVGDRIDEMAFELPLVGGDRPTADLPVTAIASLLRRHLPAGDPLAGYPDRLAEPSLAAELRGFLTGSLDLVMRVRPSEGGERFAVVDYKTNRLAGPGEPLTAWHYRPEALADEMQREHYPLQAILYLVALHRYLRWRLPAYDPEHHLAGVFYLFLRGMTGPATPRIGATPCGVFAWRPPAAMVAELSDLFDRGWRPA